MLWSKNSANVVAGMHFGRGAWSYALRVYANACWPKRRSRHTKVDAGSGARALTPTLALPSRRTSHMSRTTGTSYLGIRDVRICLPPARPPSFAKPELLRRIQHRRRVRVRIETSRRRKSFVQCLICEPPGGRHGWFSSKPLRAQLCLFPKPPNALPAHSCCSAFLEDWSNRAGDGCMFSRYAAQYVPIMTANLHQTVNLSGCFSR